MPITPFIPGTSYRSREEVQEVRKLRDPIVTFASKMLEQNILTQDEIKAIDDEVRAELAIVEKQAIEDPELNVDEMYNNVFINPEPNFKIRGCDNFTYKSSK
jgi:pyruvate dehydrogenase E1 component alpha subunit